MKKFRNIICAICIVCGAFSCSDMLETDSSRQVFDPSLDAKTDSVFYALGILQGMQQLADQYVFQGEMRGDLVKTTTYTDNNLRQLADFSANATNKYDSAYVYYRVINNCNYYIAHRDTSLRTGAEYVAMREYVAVKAIRAWAYMQLARTYGKVPFYTEPLTQISQIDGSNFDELDMKGIVNRLAPDLEQYTGYTTPDFGGSTPSNDPYNPGKLFIPVDIVLGDMYLETEQFDKAASHYVTYLTEVASPANRHMGYTEGYQAPRFNPYEVQLPDDFSGNRNIIVSSKWSDIFTSINTPSSVISYIPMAANKRAGTTTELPKAFGFDYYANKQGFIDEIQISASDSYLNLSDNQDFYYYSTLSASGSVVVNAAKLGDMRYKSIINETRNSDDGDETTVWIMKFNRARVVLYRNTTVFMHLAEAFNRLGMPDAAFAILKDGIHAFLIDKAAYLTDETKEALQTTYPLLSQVNAPKFPGEGDSQFMIGVHAHGSGYACDFYNASTGGYGAFLSPYQYEPVVSAKMQEIADTYNVEVGVTKEDYMNAVEDLLCDEYALEFAFEGSRFYDLCRLARHKNAAGLYGADFGSRWLAKKLAYKNPVVNLEDENNWYLPFK